MSGREQALSLLAQANNHGDLAVKLSSLKQAKAILSSLEPSLSSDLFPFLIKLQFSPETLVRKTLIEVVEEIGLKAMGHLSMLMPVVLTLLKDKDCVVATQSIVSGTNIFCSVLEELCLQFHRRGIVDKWLEELWTWAVRFKDAVLNIIWEAAPLGTKLLALKFLETYVLIFTSNTNGSEQHAIEAKKRQMVNISWVVGGHPVLDPVTLTSEANGLLGVLFDLLRSVSSLPGQLTISVINCLAAIARKRPLHYNSILSALLDFNPNFEMVKGHMASIQYSLRTAYLGFLRCTYPVILESRERLFRALRGMNAGDAADQAIRQADKMMKNNERASRESRHAKDDQSPNQVPGGGEAMRKRSLPLDNEESIGDHDVAYKRIRRGPNNHSDHSGPTNDFGQDYSVNGLSKPSLPDNDLTPAEQMIAMIGALLAEGERGVDSLEVLINKIHPDLLADIVITNMKHLPKNPPSSTIVCTQPAAQQSGSSGPASVSIPAVSAPSVSSGVTCTSFPDMSTPVSLPADSKRDPRRDPRRLDPRRAVVPVELPPMPIVEEKNSTQPELVVPLPVFTSGEKATVPPMPKIELVVPDIEGPIVSLSDQPPFKEDVFHEETKVITPALEITPASPLPNNENDEDLVASKPFEMIVIDEVEDDSLALLDSEEFTPSSSNVTVPEEVYANVPVVTSVIELTEKQQTNVRKVAVERVIESYKYIQGDECSQTRMALLARLVAQIDADDDALVMMREHVLSDYQLQKGHELVMHVLYHLYTLMISDSVGQSAVAAIVYEKFLLGVAKSLLKDLPASDKSFSRLFGEAPFLPAAVLDMLDSLCYANYQFEKDVRDGGDRVTQGLGTVWSLILGRPVNRQACLDIALKCAIHSEDEIRAKAIRLVTNKLYPLDYISADIEQFARRMLFTAVDRRVSDRELSGSAPTELQTEGDASERGSEETSISGSQFLEPGTSVNDSIKGAQLDSQNDSSLSFAEAQRLISLFFALCTKRPTLLRCVFESYTRAPKSVKQAIHRHIPILIRTLGSSYSELLRIVSDPPLGSENLLTQVLNILCEETTPSDELIAIVRHLYETKLKDATILIPILSSLSKVEVLPIFPRLVELPLDKFQTALAHILQGSAHTGPALTPAEVLVAIHNIAPEKDGLTLKKITDVCTACFEQRTVFTQQVLAKALNQMVDQIPLPLLFMRTVIQAIDAFPALVDFVMEILSKLVTKQIWRMPKLWVGFLKCVSQTQPHSFRVLLQLPPQQLESSLNKYASLRAPLTVYASQPSLRSSLPRSTLLLLGIENESHNQQRVATTSSHRASDAASSVHGATIT